MLDFFGGSELASSTVSETAERTQKTNPKYPDDYAVIPKKTILHRIATGECLSERVYWALVLLSWCRPGWCAYACVRDARGFIWKPTLDAEPTPAGYAQIAAVLNLDPIGAKSAISKAVTFLRKTGAVRKLDGKLFPVRQPEVGSTGNEKLLVRATFKVGGKTFDPGEWIDPDTKEPVNEETRKAGMQWISECSLAWRTFLRVGKYEKETLAVQGLLDLRILIDKKTTKRTTTTEAVEEPKAPVVADEPAKPPEPEPTAPSTNDVREVQAALSAYGMADEPTSERMIERSRKEFPEATAGEITGMVHAKARTLTRNAQSPIGVLMNAVPAGFRGYQRPPDPHQGQLERNIAAWKEAIDSEWETPEGKEQARECLKREGIDYP